MSSSIHPSAQISESAFIDDGVEIGAFSVIGANVKIARGNQIHSHVVIDGHTTLGEDNIIHSFAAVGGAPQDLKFEGEPGELIIGKGNKIREYVTLHIGTKGGGMKTFIGDNNLFMASSHVAHDCKIGNNNVFANSVALAGHVEIGNNSVLGGMTGVHQFSCVGNYSMIGAGSMVSQDIPPFSMAQGDRCKLRGINSLALKRSGFSVEESAQIKKAWRSLFWKSGKVSEKIETLEPELIQNPKVEQMLSFLNRSINEGRSVCSISKN